MDRDPSAPTPQSLPKLLWPSTTTPPTRMLRLYHLYLPSYQLEPDPPLARCVPYRAARDAFPSPTHSHLLPLLKPVRGPCLFHLIPTTVTDTTVVHSGLETKGQAGTQGQTRHPYLFSRPQHHQHQHLGTPQLQFRVSLQPRPAPRPQPSSSRPNRRCVGCDVGLHRTHPVCRTVALLVLHCFFRLAASACTHFRTSPRPLLEPAC